MPLVDPRTGDAAVPAPTDVKKNHDPAELAKHEANLNRLRTELMKGFVTDMMPSDERPMLVKRDAERVMEHYDARWREQVRLLNATGFPHLADEDWLRNEMQAVLDESKRRTHLQLPLHKLPDLAEYSLLPLMATPAGMLYINDQAALCVADTGLVQVWLRCPSESIDQWASGWAPKPERLPIMEQAELTLQQLYNLVGAVGVARVVNLPEGLMQQARTPRAPKKLFR